MIYVIYSEKEPKQEILVSREDHEFLLKFTWHIRSSGYAYTNIDSKPVAMHSLVYGAKKSGQMVDHINRNKLDNRRTNLRAVSAQQNALNRGKMQPAKRKYHSPYVGVFHKKTTTGVSYEAGMSLKSRYFSLGRFRDEREAAMQRDAFAYKVHGHLAFLNFPDKVEEYKTWQFSESVMRRYEKWG